jgi:hypothetical protein
MKTEQTVEVQVCVQTACRLITLTSIGYYEIPCDSSESLCVYSPLIRNVSLSASK